MLIFWNIFSQSERTVIFEAFLVGEGGGGTDVPTLNFKTFHFANVFALFSVALAF